jgi:lipopolysaccharide biosynthesis regulator YciM
MSSTSFFIVFLGVAALVAFLILRERWRSHGLRSRESPYIRGLAALIDGNDRGALDSLKDAVRDDSGNIDAYLRLGDLYRRNRKPQHAYQIHRGLLVRPHLSAALQARVGESLAEDFLALGKPERAREVLADIERLALDSGARNRIASLAERCGEWEKAFAIRKDVWKEDRAGESPTRLALYRTWTACQMLRDRESADVREELREALKLDGACVPAHLALGDVFYLRSELDEAIHHWRRIVDQTPRLAFLTFERLERAFFDRGTLGRGTLGDLEAIYDRLLREHPDDATTLEALGNLHHKRGELTEAINVCQKALEIAPKSRGLRRRLVLLLHEAGRVRESERELDELLQVLADGAEEFVARAREAAALHPIWECSDFNDWTLFASAFAPGAEPPRPRRR